MEYTTPPHSRAPTDPHDLAPIQTGSSSNYEKNAARARTAYTAATPVTMRGEYGEAASMLGMTSASATTSTGASGPGGGGAGDRGAVEEKAAETQSRAHGGPTPNFDFSGAIGSLAGGDERKKMLSNPPSVGAGAVGRSIVWKVGKGVRRGDLPFMLVFIA